MKIWIYTCRPDDYGGLLAGIEDDDEAGHDSRFVSLQDHRAAITMAAEAEREACAEHLADHARKAADSGCYEVAELLFKIAGEFSRPVYADPNVLAEHGREQENCP